MGYLCQKETQMLTIYHNPRCGKSREGLQLLESLDIPFETLKYLTEPLTKEELTGLIQKLGIRPIELVRTKETVWKENYQGKQLTDAQVVEAMAEHPILMERPVVVNGDRAVIARPAEKVKEIL